MKIIARAGDEVIVSNIGHQRWQFGANGYSLIEESDQSTEIRLEGLGV